MDNDKVVDTNSFRHHHPAQPVLDPKLVYDTLGKYTPSQAAQPAVESSDRFRLFMAFAIGSIHPYRSGASDNHPFGYFTAALEVWTPSKSSFNTIEDIEHLLLIAQFGSFYDIGIVLICLPDPLFLPWKLSV